MAIVARYWVGAGRAPPYYHFPRGWTIGSNGWAQRTRVGEMSTADCWREVRAVEPAILERVALAFPDAAAVPRRIARGRRLSRPWSDVVVSAGGGGGGATRRG